MTIKSEYLRVILMGINVPAEELTRNWTKACYVLREIISNSDKQK